MKRFVALGFLLSSSIFAADEGASPKADMHLLLKDVQSLEKYLLSEEEFANPSSAPTIQKTLADLAKHIGGMEKKKELFKDNPAMRMNLQMLGRHLEDTQSFFKEGNKKFARLMVHNSLQMCASCHSSTSRGADLSTMFEEREASTISEADYLFATRQFTNAEKAYKKLVGGFPKNGLSRLDVQNALLSLAIFYARVKPDPEEATLYFRALSTKEELPFYLRQDLKTWAISFNRWSNERARKLKGAELLKEAKRLLEKDDFGLVESDRKFHVKRLRASALLHAFLDEPGMPQAKGEALHLLGLIYSRIQHNLFFRFSEMYLEACIHEYKKTRIARGCYDSLERIIVEGYTGSAGTNIPEDVNEDLGRLKKLAY